MAVEDVAEAAAAEEAAVAVVVAEDAEDKRRNRDEGNENEIKINNYDFLKIYADRFCD